jgi:hypothetical protein
MSSAAVLDRTMVSETVARSQALVDERRMRTILASPEQVHIKYNSEATSLHILDVEKGRVILCVERQTETGGSICREEVTEARIGRGLL